MKKFDSKFLEAYFICGTQDLQQNQTLPGLLEQALEAGITAYQFREKGINSISDKSARLTMAQELHHLCQKYNVPFIIDDDVQLAKSVHAEGIHVGQDDENISQVIKEAKNTMFVGYSCSTLAEIETANQIEGIDYYGSGPVFATQSKDDADPVIGLAELSKLVKHSSRPIVAIGGIEEKDLPAIAQTNASGASVISMITQSNDIKQTVTQMLQAPWQT